MEENKKNDKDVKNETIEWIKCIGTAVVIVILIKTFIFNSTYVFGDSMYPTLHSRDRLFANKISLLFTKPSRGDVVIIHAPDVEDKDYIKRLVGLEGETIEIIDGKVYINGEIYEEEYLSEDSYTEPYNNTSYWEIPIGYIFVLGDNRAPNASKDSRDFGPVPLDSVTGIAGFRYFPLDKRFGIVN